VLSAQCSVQSAKCKVPDGLCGGNGLKSSQLYVISFPSQLNKSQEFKKYKSLL